MADYEKASLTRAQTLAMMGVVVWHERTGEISHEADSAVGVQASQARQDSADLQDATVRGPAAARALLAEAPASQPRQTSVSTPSTSITQPAEDDKPIGVPAAHAEIIEFTWVKGSQGLIILGLCSDSATLMLLKDVARYADWRVANSQHGEQSAATSGKSSVGDFRWPQLVDTAGTPLRALRAFFGKHLPQGGWLAVTADAMPQLSAWLQELEISALELPTLEHNIGDAAIKRAIWRQLINLG